jgi:outer membrane cobalamin receptor
MKIRFFAIGLGLLALGWGPGLRAEEVVIMDEVVVSATKTEEQRKDVPNAVIVVDGLDIEASPATSVGDLLGGQTGIDWRTYGNYGGAAQEIRIRGMSGDGTQVLVNGVTVNSPSLGTSDVGAIPMNAIDRIEVVKGSGSVLYGSGAMGGIVNIVTKEPRRDQVDLKASAGYGSENTYQLSAENGMFVVGDLGYYITVNRSETDGFRDNSDLTQNDASAKLVLDKGETLHLSLYADIIDRESGRPGVETPAGTETFRVNGVAVYNNESANLLNEQSDLNKHIVLALKSRPLSWLGINLQTDYTTMESDNYNRYYDSWTAGNLPGSKTEVINDIFGIEGNFEITPFSGATVLIGAQHKDYDWGYTSVTLDGYGDPASELDGSADVHTTGVFGEVQYRPVKYVKLSLGARNEDHSEFGSEFLPRGGLIINPTETTALKFNGGKHFKAPTPNDLFWPYEDWGYGSGSEGNPDLKPETGWHWDASLEQSLADNKLFFSATYFNWNIDDKITWVADASYFYRPENFSRYEADGWEIGAVIGPFANLTLSVDYTYVDAKEQYEGGVMRQALYSAKNFFKTGLTYWFNFGLDLTATVRYTDERPGFYADYDESEPDEILDEYWTVDLKANQRFGENWTLSCQVNNLFDENYDTYVETFYDQTGAGTKCRYPGAGQSIFVSATYTY